MIQPFLEKSSAIKSIIRQNRESANVFGHFPCSVFLKVERENSMM